MNRRSIYVDFTKRNGRIKPVSSAVGGPRSGPLLEVDFTEEFKAASIPAVRVRNAQFPYGFNQYVDVHCIFPDLTRDPEDETAYNFGPTDAYLLSVKDAGAEIFLCLGESSDPFGSKLYIKPPRDLELFASICTHIVAHYNESWALGFKLGIKYCEIFPGADEPSGFDGSPSEYAELYSKVAIALKERFPKLKVGAYSSGGFRALNHFDATEQERGYLQYLDSFLGAISKREEAVPLDFLSWRCITDSPEELSIHSSYAKTYLAQYGYKKAQSIVSEFNLTYVNINRALAMREYPALLASAFTVAQKCGIDMMFYSDLYPSSGNNAVLTVDDGFTKRLYASYGVFSAFGKLFKEKNALETTPDARRELYSLAAMGKDSAAVLLVSRDFSGELELELKDCPFSRYSIKGILGGGERGRGFSTEAANIPLESGRIYLKVGKCEVYFVTLE